MCADKSEREKMENYVWSFVLDKKLWEDLCKDSDIQSAINSVAGYINATCELRVDTGACKELPYKDTNELKGLLKHFMRIHQKSIAKL